MVGLPSATAWVVFGFPIFWIAYTVIFMIVSRGWKKEAGDKEVEG